MQILYTVLLALILVSLPYIFFHFRENRAHEYARFHEIINQNNQLLNNVISEPLYNGDIEQLTFDIDSFFSNPDIIKLSLVEYAGDIQLLRERPFTSKKGEIISNRIILQRAGDELGEIEIHYTSALIEERFSAARNRFLVFYLCLITSVIIIIILLAKKITRPIEHLSAFAEAMSEGNLGQQFEVSGSKELSALSQSLDRLRHVMREKISTMEGTNQQLMEEIDQRQRTETALEESEKKYRALFEGSIEAMLVFRGYKIIDCNDAAVKLFGFESREALISKTIADISSHSQVDGQMTESKLIDVEQETRRAGSSRFKWNYIRASGKNFNGEVSLTRILLDGEFVLHALVRDISFQERAQEALLKSEKTFRALLDVNPDTLILLAPDGVVIDTNHVAAHSLGLSPEEMIGTNVFDHLPSDLAAERKYAFDKAIKNRRSHHFFDRRGSLWLENYIAPIMNSAGHVDQVAVISRDITTIKQHEEQLLAHQLQLRALSAKLSLIEEQERRKIADALHDSLGPNLALAKMRLGAIKTFDSAEQCKENIKETIAQLSEAIHFTRNLTLDISPPVLDNLPFFNSLRWLAEHFLERNLISSEIIEQGQPEQLDKNSRILLFKVARESMINIVKHAKASQTKIVLQWADDHADLSISDNGVGFDVNNQQTDSAKQSYGLFSITERMAYLGGSVEIVSVPAQGTSIRIKFPLKLDSLTE
jgi:PAS domain S-box-containing protein